MIFMIFSKQPDPEPEPEPSRVEDDDLGERIEGFTDLGFDYLTSLALAWSQASVSECRERWLKRGATHAQCADYFLD